MSRMEAGRALPQGWRWVRLGEIGKIVSGVTLGRKVADPTRPVPYLRVANVKDGFLDLSDVYEIEATESEINKCRLEYGDLLLTEGGDPDKLGRGTFWENQLPECIHQNHIFRIRLDLNQFSPKYIAYQISSPHGKGYFLSHAKRTTGIATINQKVLGEVPLSVPPFPIQKRIAALLNEQMAAVEWARAAAQAQLEAAKALPAAYLRAVFDSPEAQKWPKVKLGEVCDFKGGMQPPKYTFKYNPQPGYVRLVQIQDFRKPDAAVYIPESEAKRTFDETDVMIGRYGPPLFQILRGLAGSYNVALIKTVPKENLLKDYLYFLLQGPDIQKSVIAQSQRSAGQTGVQKEFLEGLIVPHPPLDKQHTISMTLKANMKTAQNLQKILEDTHKFINTLPAALLRRAFNGEL